MHSKESLTAAVEQEEAARGIKFDESAGAAGEARPRTKKRVPTAFAQVTMRSDGEEEEDDTREGHVTFEEPAGGYPSEQRPARKKRVPTAFAPPVVDDGESEEDDGGSAQRQVEFQSEAGVGEPRPQRKKRVATGFVHAAPPDEEEEEEESPRGKPKTVSIQFEDAGEPRPQRKQRVATGFVHAPSAPDDDDEDEERHVNIKSKGGLGEPRPGQKKRVPTAFVRAAPDDEEDDEDEERHVNIRSQDGVGEPKPGRKKRVPTAFVRSAPGQQDEDEDEEEERGVSFRNADGLGEPRPGQKKRVPTAFVRTAPGEEEEDEEEDEEKHVTIRSNAGVGEPRAAGKKRVPTAFARPAPDDDEDDEEEDRHVSIRTNDGLGEPRPGGKKRVPTAFVRGAPDEEEDEEEEKRVSIRTADGLGEPRPGGKKRVPTAFVRAAPGEEEDDDEEEEDKRVSIRTAEGVGEPRPGGKKRVPTAFVRGAPDEDEEDDEEDKRVSIKTAEGLGEPRPGGKKRVPTAFVRGAPDEDEEDEEEERHVSIKSKGDVGEPRSGKKRVPTAFARAAPGEDEDDDEDGGHVTFSPETADNEARKKTRVPTKFVTANSLPEDDDDTERPRRRVSFEEVPGGGDDGKKPPAGAKKRVPTAFVKSKPGALDDEEEEEEEGQAGRTVKFRERDSIKNIEPASPDEEPSSPSSTGKRSIKQRIPTSFSRCSSNFGEDDDDQDDAITSRSSSKSATFADTVSESDTDPDDAFPGMAFRPSRGRTPTAFVKPPQEQRRNSVDFSSGGELSPENRRVGRARLPTAIGRRNSEELGDVAAANSPHHSLDGSDVPDYLEQYRVFDAKKDSKLIQETLRSLDFFRDLCDASCLSLVDAMEVFDLTDGAVIARQGSTNATHFFIVEEGLFEVLRDDKKLAEVSRGGLLCESVILLSGAQNATVRTKGKARAYGMSASTARQLLQQQWHDDRKEVIEAVNEMLENGVCSMFNNLNQYQENLLYDKACSAHFPAGHNILDVAQPTVKGLHVLLDGTVKVVGFEHRDENELPRYSLLGRLALVYDQNPATVVCVTPVHTLMLTRECLESMFGDKLKEKLLGSRITDLISRNPTFRTFGNEQLEAIANEGKVLEISPKEQMQMDGVCLMFCIFGEEVEASVDNSTQPVKMSGSLADSLGEDKLKAGEGPWKLNVRTLGNVPARVVVWTGTRLSKMIHLSMLKRGESTASLEDQPECSEVTRYMRSPSMKLAVLHDDKAGALRKVLVFRTCSDQQLQQLAASMTIQYTAAGDVVFEQGSKGEEFFIIHSGGVEVTIAGRRVRTLGVGDYVGERSLLFDEPRSATVKAIMDSELWKINLAAFNQVVRGPILDYMKDRIAFQNTKVELDSLACNRVVGRGGFGLVKMVQSKETGTRYALKCVSIKQAVETGQTQNLLAERNILAELDHPFVIKFIRTFKSSQYVYFLMELVTGGELLDALQELGLLGQDQAQFYVASIALALEFLHERRIAYLDLKGENCLIDHHGYLKIIDFGVAERVVNGKIFEARGTPFYMAPEVILARGYTTVADLWSLGVCVFDFMTGQFPFGNEIDPREAGATEQIFAKILKGRLKFPAGLKAKAVKDFIKGLLEKDPSKRLGAKAEGYAELKEHPFFEGFAWDALLARQLEPPYKPKKEVYAEDADNPTGTEADELCILADKAGEDAWEQATLSGLAGEGAMYNGKFKPAGTHAGRPYLQHASGDMFMYTVNEGRSWLVSPKLGDPESEAWLQSTSVPQDPSHAPPEGRWQVRAACVSGVPQVKVIMDPDPRWLEEF